MKLSRRGILGGLFASAAVPAAAVEAPKQKFIKGMIVPRYHMIAVNEHGTHFGAHHAAMVVNDYEIFDGEKFVPFNSAAGQQVMADLEG